MESAPREELIGIDMPSPAHPSSCHVWEGDENCSPVLELGFPVDGPSMNTTLDEADGECACALCTPSNTPEACCSPDTLSSYSASPWSEYFDIGMDWEPMQDGIQSNPQLSKGFAVNLELPGIERNRLAELVDPDDTLGNGYFSQQEVAISQPSPHVADQFVRVPEEHQGYPSLQEAHLLCDSSVDSYLPSVLGSDFFVDMLLDVAQKFGFEKDVAASELFGRATEAFRSRMGGQKITEAKDVAAGLFARHVTCCMMEKTGHTHDTGKFQLESLKFLESLQPGPVREALEKLLEEWFDPSYCLWPETLHVDNNHQSRPLVEPCAPGQPQGPRFDQQAYVVDQPVADLTGGGLYAGTAYAQPLSPKAHSSPTAFYPTAGDKPASVGKIVSCSQCTQQFAGKSAVGNRNRHEKYKHGKDKQESWGLKCHRCSKTFERPDNRMKHERNAKCQPRRPGDVVQQYSVSGGPVRVEM